MGKKSESDKCIEACDAFRKDKNKRIKFNANCTMAGTTTTAAPVKGKTNSTKCFLACEACTEPENNKNGAFCKKYTEWFPCPEKPKQEQKDAENVLGYVIGGIVGLLMIILIICAIVIYLKMTRRRRQRVGEPHPDEVAISIAPELPDQANGVQPTPSLDALNKKTPAS